MGSVFRQKTVGKLGQPVKPTVEPLTIPASVGGVNALTSIMGQGPEDSIYTFNIMPSEYGQRLRKGYREWATGVDGDVRSFIPYDDQGGDTARDRLFAVTENGIYDVTLFNTTAPSQVVNFTQTGPAAGYGVYTQFVTDAADHLVLYADGDNGLHQYNGTDQVWSVPAITGADPAQVAFITQHKQRLWIAEEDSSDAWYLPVDSIAGVATKFNFASKFKHGGRLMGMYNWTVDGGDGVDDFLVVVSKAGDVLVYHGSDPSAVDWDLRGQYFIGEIPNSRKVAEAQAGELYLLSIYGIISVRALVSGVAFADPKVGPSGKINRFLRNEVAQKIDSLDWQLVVHPADGFLQAITPWQDFNVPPRQYSMNLLTNAWAWWTNVPILCAENWRRDYMMGGPGGIVYIYDGTLDNTKLDQTLGQPIDFGNLTSFQPYGNHGQYMRTAYIRTVGITAGVVAVNIDAVYDYNIETVINAPPTAPAQSASVWDTALWDIDVWDYDAEGAAVPLGSSGWGRTMAIGMRGSSDSRITIVGWDVMFNTGGLL